MRKYYVENSHEAIIDKTTFEQVQAEMAARAAKNTQQHKESVEGCRLFRSMIRCGICGRTYKHYRTNAKKYDKSVWACPNFYMLGKEICPAQKIPEDILIEKTMETLSVTTLDPKLLQERVHSIIVPAHHQLRFIMKDGTVIETEWRHRSRKESWTEEMRQAARERALSQRRKEKK